MSICVVLRADELPFQRHDVGTGLWGAWSVTAADFDQDGDEDLLSATRGSGGREDGSVEWWENPGSLSSSATPWADHSIREAFEDARSAFPGDMDLDGDMDVVAVAHDTGEVCWWENDGLGGGWLEHAIDDDFLLAYCVYPVDIDGDGDLDVAGVTTGAIQLPSPPPYDGLLTWWENEGAGVSWTEHNINDTLGGPDWLYAGDVDGDGDKDLMVSYSYDLAISWWENASSEGDGSAWVEHVVVENIRALCVYAEDMDQDGDLDLLGGSFDTGRISWWENEENTWTEQVIQFEDYFFESLFTIHATDMDNDGDIDVVAGDRGGNGYVFWWENTSGDATSWQGRIVEGLRFQATRSVLSHDLDRDGDIDVLGAADADGKVSCWENTTIHRSTEYSRVEGVSASLSDLRSVRFGDINRDGKTDLLSAAYGDDGVYWHENLGGTTPFFAKHLVSDAVLGASAAALADLDGDGALDIVSAAKDANTVAWHHNSTRDGGAWTTVSLYNKANAVDALALNDLDRDGDTDIIFLSSEDNPRVGWLENQQGDASSWKLRGVLNSSASGTVAAIAVADLDHDGLEDVLAADSENGVLRWAQNLGGERLSFLGRVIASETTAITALATGDINKDGKLDVVVAEGDSDSLAWYNAQGNPYSNAWDRIPIDSSIHLPNSLWVDDFDQDGDPDVAALGTAPNGAVWMENLDGLGLSWAQHNLPLSPSGNPDICATDLNQDGRINLIAAAGQGDFLDWLPNLGGQYRVDTTSIAPDELVPGQDRAVFQMDFQHLGRLGDTAAQWIETRLGMVDSYGLPMGDEAAAALIETFLLYRDDGSGDFEEGDDTLVASFAAALVNGEQGLSFPNTADFEIEAESYVRFFLVPQLQADAAEGATTSFRLQHLVESNTVAQSASEALRLSAAAHEDAQSDLILAGTGPEFSTIHVSPLGVNEGDLITISFTSTQTLSEYPVVLLNDAETLFQSQTGEDYAFEYTVQASDLEGLATIAISGVNMSGNSGSATTSVDLTKEEAPDIHDGDYDAVKHVISLSEILRFIQLYNSEGYHCAQEGDISDEGYMPGPGDQASCRAHTGDYNEGGPDWIIDLSELLRFIQFFNSGAITNVTILNRTKGIAQDPIAHRDAHAACCQ